MHDNYKQNKITIKNMEICHRNISHQSTLTKNMIIYHKKLLNLIVTNNSTPKNIVCNSKQNSGFAGYTTTSQITLLLI